MKIKSWDDFQHFKDRTPPWIKLYRYLLDDHQWHRLDGESCKILVMLWLIASEDKAMDGNLPDMETLCFRLRIDESVLRQSINKLSHWVIFNDNDLISECHHRVIPETETETETETYSSSFSEFWERYPRKVGKDSAYKSWQKKNPPIDEVMFALSWQIESEQWAKNRGKFIPHPSTYINQGRWKDEPPQEQEPGF